MTKLYLVRHGETDWNKQNRCQGCIDIDLNEDGILQAKAVSKRLASEKIDMIYSSELTRAYHTADIINEQLSCEIKKDKALNEIDFGDWEGLTFEEMRVRPDYNYLHWKSEPHKAAFPGEGSLQIVQDRAMKLIRQIIQEHSGKNILVVSHGGILKTVILGLLDIGLEAYNKFYITNTSISIVSVEQERNYIHVLNDTCHLQDMIKTKPIF
ncbi:MAG: histidine phosphatase family protein [Clostridia bacterium]|nr:histidine phosphatase family protein [Clostridia bacterium]